MSDRDDPSSRPDDGDDRGPDDENGGDVEAALADEPLGEPRRIDDRVRYQWLVGSTFGAAVSAVIGWAWTCPFPST